MAQLIETRFSLTPEPPFHFANTAYSHGWVALHPNQWDKEQQKLQRAEHLSSGNVVNISVENSGSIHEPIICIDVQHAESLTEAELQEISKNVRHMFRLDENFHEFYSICKSAGKQWQKMSNGLGRLLRSPSVYEDIVKTICTTNIQWGGTKRMVEGIVREFGAPFPGDENLNAFPSPQAIAAIPFAEFSKRVNLGYRSDYIHLLSRRIADGELEPEQFLDPEIPTPELKKSLLRIKGIGNYAAATMLMLLGRYDELPVDSVFRQFVSQKYFGGAPMSDKDGAAIYDDWGKWKYLAYWFDVWEGTTENV